jgi:hypothetical protein
VVTVTHDGSSDASRVVVSDGRSVDDPAAVRCWINGQARGSTTSKFRLCNVETARETTASPSESAVIHLGQPV